jgi:hypothetical protein
MADDPDRAIAGQEAWGLFVQGDLRLAADAE